MLKTKILLLFCLLVGLASSCKKDKYDAEKQAAIDDALIVDFIAKNGIVAVKHESGLYYQVLSSGAGNKVTIANTVSVDYEGRFLNGTTFEKSASTISFPLNGVILGWQIGIPQIRKGGEIRLIIPSTLAYKNNPPSTKIPKNAVLDFTVKLVNVQ